MDESSSLSQRLIIGLGSLGTAIVAGASEQMARLVGAHRCVCLGLDTDQSVVDLIRRMEVFPLATDAPPRGFRKAGRDAFLEELPAVSEWLNGHLRKLSGQGKLQVTLVSSLAGGTGSSVLVDLAYLLRRLVGSETPLELEALVTHSARPPRTEMGGANAYASLTELNHWMAPDTTYRLDDYETSEPPVDRVGLLSCRDLGDSLDREGLPAQFTAYLALSLWPGARLVWGEAEQTFSKIQGRVDQDGNPLAYFSPAAVAMLLPAVRVRNAMLLSLFEATLRRWQEQSGGSEQADEAALSTHAQEFLSKQGLVPRQVMIKLGHAAGGTQGFMKSPQVSTMFDEIERRPPQGSALGQKIRELETLILQTIGPSGPDGMLGHSRHHAKQVKEHCLASLKEELKSASTMAGYATYVHHLRNALVDRMESLAREVERAEAEEEQLEQDKDARLHELTQPEETGLVGRLFGKKKDNSDQVSTLLRQIEAFYANRLKLEFHRIGTTVFADVLKEVEQVHGQSSRVHLFLDQLLELARKARGQALEELGSELHVSSQEVEKLLAPRLGASEVEKVSRALLKDPGDVKSLPTHLPPAEAARTMLTVMEEQLPALLELDVMEYLSRQQPERAEALEQRARPVLQPRTHLEGYHPLPMVAVAAGVKLPGFETVMMPGKEGVALLGMRAGFPMRALELSPLHQSYLHELRQSKVQAHNREDVPWRALERTSASRREELWLTLSQGVQLGHLQPGDPIESRRWPEMGPVKRCLLRFARPEEALVEETHFLIALNYWREEKLEELGVEEFLLLLEPQEKERSLLGESIEPWLARARERLLALQRENWPSWERLVNDYLETSPFVSEADLVEIPAGFRRWVLSHYAAGLPDSEVVFNPELGRLEKASARTAPHQS